MTEHGEQSAVIQWARLFQDRHPELQNLFAIPNGGARHPIVAMKLKDEGVKKGVPDLFLACSKENIPESGYKLCGLFIEMKFGKNRQSPEQKEWEKRLLEQGYRYRICYSSEEAIREICEYLGIPYMLDR